MRATMQEGVLFGSETIVAKAPVAVCRMLAMI